MTEVYNMVQQKCVIQHWPPKKFGWIFSIDYHFATLRTFRLVLTSGLFNGRGFFSKGGALVAPEAPPGYWLPTWRVGHGAPLRIFGSSYSKEGHLWDDVPLQGVESVVCKFAQHLVDL